MKKVHKDEFTASELFELAETLNLETKSKDTKAMLVEKINAEITLLDASGLELEQTPSDISDTPETVVVVEEPSIVEIEKAKVHKGFHPITGKPVD